MSTQSIRFNGINRHPNAVDSNVGDCEELINIKSEDGSLKIDKDKKVISADIPYKRIIIHKLQTTENYIGFDDSGVIWFDPQSGDIKNRLYESSTGLENIFISTISNMVVISDKNTITNTVYLFTDGNYEIFAENTSNFPDVNITHTIEKCEEHLRGDLLQKEELIKDAQKRVDMLKGVFNKVLAKNPKYVFGYYLIGINFTLYDNSETRLSHLRAFYPDITPYNNNPNEFIIPATDLGDVLSIRYDEIVTSHKYTLSIDGNIKKEYIKSVNVYISNPISFIQFKVNEIEFDLENLKYNALRLQDAGLESQLMYKYKSYNIDELSTPVTEQIEFGIDTLATNKTLDVDAGLVTRAGQMQTYNNRLHLFNSVAKIDLTDGFHIKSCAQTDLQYNADVIIYIRNTKGEDIRLRYPGLTFYSSVPSESYYTLLDYMLIVQDSRAYKVVFTRPGYYAECLLESSPRYNYAYAYFKQIEFVAGDKYSNVSINDTYQELNAINVTAQNNPIYFPVEHSYAFNGNIVDIAYATEPISESQIGQYPLYVFTDNGIYTLHQGDGNVLYSNITLINTDDTSKSKGVCQTRNGVAYIANGAIYILSGRKNLNITLPLKGPIDTDIRQNKSYQLCCMNDRLYDVTDALSQVKFEEYLLNAKLSYSAPSDELFVCNRDYPYSYVFSFIYKAWHKITEQFEKVNDNILQKFILTNNPTAVQAEGKIYVTNAIIQPSHQFSALYQATVSDVTSTSGLSGRFALVINNAQVSAAYLRYPTPLSLIVGLLCKDIPYLDEYYDGQQYKIYSSMDLGAGTTLQIINLATNYAIINATFEDITDTVVTIPDKGIGESINISSSYRDLGTTLVYEQTTRPIVNSDTVISIAELIAQTINAESIMFRITANTSNNIINISANTAGTNGNNTTIECSQNRYIGTYIEPLSGGKDINMQPGMYSQLVDYTQEVDSVKTIHLQSRVISWPNVYTLINRAILSCKADLTPEQNLSIYLFASNNLKEWKCICGTQKSSATIDHIRLQRAAKAWKYFVIMIGGTVYSTTELSAITMDIRGQISNKLR